MYSGTMIDETLLEKIAAYRPSESTIALLRNTPIALIVGVSGAGKDTIVNKLLQKSDYRAIVSHTTRAMRENRGVLEQNGVDYNFIDIPTAIKMIDDHAFIEVKTYSQNIYGTSAAEVQKAHDEGKIAISDVEVKGVAEYVTLTPTVRPIFVLPPSYDIWQQRLLSRYGDDQLAHTEDIERRLRTARDELLHVRSADYFSIIVNDDLENTVQKADELAHATNNIPERTPAALQLVEVLLARLQETLGEA
jgi:guanylate kinase